MLWLARLPSNSRQGQQLELVNTIFPVGQNGVFESICLIQTRDAFDTGRVQWLSRPISDKQFLSLVVPQTGGQISVISISPSSGQVLALVRNSENQQILSIYSPDFNGWKPLPPMIASRNLNSFSGAVIGDFLYVAGGFPIKGSGTMKFREAERFDLRTNQWERIPEMKQFNALRKGFAMDGYFFVIPSFISSHPLFCAAERFDPATNLWTFIPEFLPQDIERFTVAVLKNELYLLKWSRVEPCGGLLKYDKSTGGWIFIDRVPDFDSKFCSKKQLYPVGTELWIVNCHHSEKLCECNKVFSENSAWHVFEGPSFRPAQLENINGVEPHKFVHACKIAPASFFVPPAC
ncbi:hypothetical protein SUGI_0416910 [Cryptomeria japonica]|nr:hypothetical protein SUGI_0416910 [Cryptomeria japonica]